MTPPFRPSLFDRIADGGNRLFGLPRGLLSEEEQRFAQQQGLLGLGGSLLRASGPSREPVGLGQAIGEAIPQGQAAAFQGLQTQGFLQQRQAAQQAAQRRSEILAQTSPEDLQETMQQLVTAGDLDGALQISKLLESTQAEGARLLQVPAGDRVELRDPITGELVATVPKAEAAETSKQFEQENALLGRFISVSGDERSVALSYRSVLAAAQDPTAAGDLALIFSFMKMLDPGSVVREGEFATAQNAANVPGRVRNAYNRIVDGTRLNTEQRADFVNQAHNKARTTDRGLQERIRQFGERAERAGLDPRNVTLDPFAGLEIPDRGTEIPKTPSPDLGETTQSALDELMDQAAKIRRRISEFRGRDVLTPFEADTTRGR